MFYNYHPPNMLVAAKCYASPIYAYCVTNCFSTLLSNIQRYNFMISIRETFHSCKLVKEGNFVLKILLWLQCC